MFGKVHITERTRMFEVLGMVGTGIAVVAYVPQVVLLVQTRNSTGVSIRSWSLWLLATTLIMLTAHTGTDLVFKTLTTSNWLFAVVILTLAIAFQPGRRYSRATGSTATRRI